MKTISELLDGLTVQDFELDEDPVANQCVVRLRTAAWGDKNGGIHTRKSITFMKRQCTGFNVLAEDIHALGVEEVISRITNLYECDDGVYEVVTCNDVRDWESGYVEDYDFKLVRVA